MEIGIKVGDVMTRDFIAVTPETNLKECAVLMIKKRIGSLIIRENKKLKGFLTERDIIWALTKNSCKDLGKIKASQLGKRKITTIRASSDLYEALQKMRDSKNRWLPVTEDGNVIGFLTLKDILRIQPELFDIVKNHDIFNIKEEKEKLIRINKKTVKEGMCEECGKFSSLINMEGRLLCENCREN